MSTVLQSKTEEITKLLSGKGESIPLFKVYMPPEAIEAAVEVMQSGYIGQGPRVEKFEEALKGWISQGYPLSLNSGTSALHLALRLSGVEHGTEVISTPVTCMATNVPILANGASICWADVNPKTGNICPKSVSEKINSKTKAVICVDWGGYPCDLEELKKVCHENGIKLIEDAAHGFGSKYKGKLIGGIADFTCFSFQAIKHITTVDGGALVCRDENDYKKGKLLRWYGIDREGPRLDFRCEEDVAEYGYKFHMNDVAAAIGFVQLQHVDKVLKSHQANAAYYNEQFEGYVELLDYKQDRVSAYWLYTFLVNHRLQFMEKMKRKGITVSQVHARNDKHTVFKSFRTDLPGVEAFTSQHVCIPVGWWLTEEERKHIADAVIEALR